MYRREIYREDLSIGESYRRTAGLGLIPRDRDEETLAGSLVLSQLHAHVEDSPLALNTRKKTAALGSGSKLPLPRDLWRGLHIGVDDEIRTHAGKAQRLREALSLLNTT